MSDEEDSQVQHQEDREDCESFEADEALKPKKTKKKKKEKKKKKKKKKKKQQPNQSEDHRDSELPSLVSGDLNIGVDYSQDASEKLLGDDVESQLPYEGEEKTVFSKKKMLIAATLGFGMILIIGISVGVSGSKKSPNVPPAPSPTPGPPPGPGPPSPAPHPAKKCSEGGKCTDLNQHCSPRHVCVCNTGSYAYQNSTRGFNCLLSDNAAERTSLVDLFAKTDGFQWTSKDHWNSTTTSVCGWYGVGCEYDGNDQHGYVSKVTSLALASNKVRGELPNSISNLTHLTCLNVQSNSVTKLPDKLPTKLLTCVVPDKPWEHDPGLSIVSNKIQVLPSSVCELAELTQLKLDDNLIVEMPSCLKEMKAVTSVSALRNRLNNTAVTQLCELPHLAQVDVSQNKPLNGTVPSCIASWG